MKKATYSDGFKERALPTVFGRGDRTVQVVAEELNISVHTLKNWMKKSLPDDQNRPVRKAKRPQGWSPEERLRAQQEIHGLRGDSLNADVGACSHIPTCLRAERGFAGTGTSVAIKYLGINLKGRNAFYCCHLGSERRGPQLAELGLSKSDLVLIDK